MENAFQPAVGMLVAVYGGARAVQPDGLVGGALAHGLDGRAVSAEMGVLAFEAARPSVLHGRAPGTEFDAAAAVLAVVLAVVAAVVVATACAVLRRVLEARRGTHLHGGVHGGTGKGRGRARAPRSPMTGRGCRRRRGDS